MAVIQVVDERLHSSCPFVGLLVIFVPWSIVWLLHILLRVTSKSRSHVLIVSRGSAGSFPGFFCLRNIPSLGLPAGVLYCHEGVTSLLICQYVPIWDIIIWLSCQSGACQTSRCP